MRAHSILQIDLNIVTNVTQFLAFVVRVHCAISTTLASGAFANHIYAQLSR